MLWAGNEGYAEFFQDLAMRWRGMREPLLAFAAGHPRPEVQKAASDLVDAVTRSLGHTKFGMEAVAQGADDLIGPRSRALAEYQIALTDADKLLRLIREEPQDLRPLSEQFGPLDAEELP